MIFLKRNRDTGITRSLRGNNRKKRELELLKLKRDSLKTGDPKIKFKPGRWRSAKKQLKKESADKCAYCEADTSVVAHGDVEHFRPKSIYWWLAYCYDNMLFACQICNQTFKSNHFPVPGSRLHAPRVTKNDSDATLKSKAGTLTPDPVQTGQGKPLPTFLAEVIDEDADLVDPYVVDPVTMFKWATDDDEQSVAIKPLRNSGKPKRAHRAAVNFYGLNREELLRLRYERYTQAQVLKL